MHTGDPSRKVGLHLWEQLSEMGMPAQDASRLQSCSHKSRDNLFLLQGNCAGMSSWVRLHWAVWVPPAWLWCPV